MGTHSDQLWLLFTSVNKTTTQTEDYTGSLRVSSPCKAGVIVRNLFRPYENYTLAASLSPYYSNGQAPYYGCMGSIMMPPMGPKVLVPVEEWVPPLPAVSKFVPGHDARIEVQDNATNRTTVDIYFEFSDLMDCDSVAESMSFNMSSSGHGGTPTIASGSVQCLKMDPNTVPPAELPGVSAWYWKATLNNVQDGILAITINDPENQADASTGVSGFSFSGERASNGWDTSRRQSTSFSARA